MNNYQTLSPQHSSSITPEDRVFFYAGVIGGYIMILLDKETEKFSPTNEKLLKTALSVGPFIPGGSVLIYASATAIIFKNREKINHILWKKYLHLKHGI